MDHRLLYQKYTIRRKALTKMGGNLHIYDLNGQLILYSRLLPLEFKKDIRLYTGEDEQEELIRIKARQVFDYEAFYDVFDSKTEEKVGTIQRKGFKSFFKSEWLILDSKEVVIGRILEDGLALVRRMFPLIFSPRFDVFFQNTKVGEFKYDSPMLALKLNINFGMDTAGIFDRRMGIAAALTICAIEGKQF